MTSSVAQPVVFSPQVVRFEFTGFLLRCFDLVCADRAGGLRFVSASAEVHGRGQRTRCAGRRLGGRDGRRRSARCHPLAYEKGCPRSYLVFMEARVSQCSTVRWRQCLAFIGIPYSRWAMSFRCLVVSDVRPFLKSPATDWSMRDLAGINFSRVRPSWRIR